MDKRQVFENVLSAIREPNFPHLDEMSVDELCRQRIQVADKIKELEGEKKAIDDYLMFHLSAVELLHGIRIDSEHIITMRKKTTWKYSSQLKEHINEMRKHEQKSGEAYSEITEYICLTRL
jgi:predicted ATP-dependent protease